MKSKRKSFVLIILIGALVICVAAIKEDNNKSKLISIPPSEQRSGDITKGFNYLVTGDYVKSGPSYGYYVLINGKDKNNFLNRTGKNATLGYNYNLATSEKGIDVVVPNCLQCHAQV